MIRKHTLTRRPSPKTDKPYRIRTLGSVADMPFHTTRGTYDDDVMLLLFTEGKGQYHSESQIKQVHSGMLGIILPEYDPGILISDPNEPYTHIYCRFSGTEAQKVAKRISEKYDKQTFFPCPSWREMHQILQVMITYHEFDKDYTKNPDEPIRPEEGLLAHLLALLEYQKPSNRRRVTESSLRRYILGHIAEPINLDAIAEHFGLSKSYLCRLARQELGDTLQRAMESAKMEWANALLTNSELAHLSIQEVAMHVGYEDALYFSKVFKRAYGESPRIWRALRLSDR